MRDGQRAPDQLAQGQALAEVASVGDVEPVDHHQPEPVEQGDDREQEGVGVRRPPPQHEVEGEGDAEQPPPWLTQAGRERAADGQPDVDVGQRDDADGEQQQHQLDVAAGAGGEAGDRGHLVVVGGVVAGGGGRCGRGRGGRDGVGVLESSQAPPVARLAAQRRASVRSWLNAGPARPEGVGRDAVLDLLAR